MKCEIQFKCTASKEPCPGETGNWPCEHLDKNGLCTNAKVKLQATDGLRSELMSEAYGIKNESTK